MAGTVILTVVDQVTYDPRITEFQRDIVGRYLPGDISFEQLDMAEIIAHMDDPPWAKSYHIEEGDHFNSTFHSKCLDRCLYTLPYEHFIILDCDAVPLGPRFFDFMLSNRSWLVGTAHAANHRTDSYKYLPYVSPSAMSISKALYCELQESFAPQRADKGHLDSGAWLTVAAQKAGVPTVLLYPTDSLYPCWQVSWSKYGFITAYADVLCHMWGGRAVGQEIFECFRDYVAMYHEAMSADDKSIITKLHVLKPHERPEDRA